MSDPQELPRNPPLRFSGVTSANFGRSFGSDALLEREQVVEMIDELHSNHAMAVEVNFSKSTSLRGTRGLAADQCSEVVGGGWGGGEAQ